MSHTQLELELIDNNLKLCEEICHSKQPVHLPNHFQTPHNSPVIQKKAAHNVNWFLYAKTADIMLTFVNVRFLGETDERVFTAVPGDNTQTISRDSHQQQCVRVRRSFCTGRLLSEETGWTQEPHGTRTVLLPHKRSSQSITVSVTYRAPLYVVLNILE